MEFLKTLQEVRTPFFEKVFSAITYLGDELVFMAVVLLVLWCVDKKWGYRLFAMGLMGTLVNQFLKALFLVPRPWVLDSAIKPVPSALEGATGYSFPSGHTQSAATLFGGVAVWLKRKTVVVVCALLVLLTAFSRMYLGVHTPMDVGVSLATGAVTVVLFALLYQNAERDGRVNAVVGALLAAVSVALLLYVLLAPKTGENVAQFDEEGLKSAYTLVGTVFGLIVSWFIDSRALRYEVRAAWWAQVLKYVLGLGLVVGVKAFLKEPLLALFSGHGAADAIRYFFIAVTAGAVWPLTFRFWAKTAEKREA